MYNVLWKNKEVNDSGKFAEKDADISHRLRPGVLTRRTVREWA